MTVAVQFTCSSGGCVTCVAVALDVRAFGDGLMVDGGLWLVETQWHELPEGWTLNGEGRALCPEHARQEATT